MRFSYVQMKMVRETIIGMLKNTKSRDFSVASFPLLEI